MSAPSSGMTRKRHTNVLARRLGHLDGKLMNGQHGRYEADWLRAEAAAIRYALDAIDELDASYESAGRSTA